jgi:acyl-CoA thioester hydrolase
MEGDRPPTRDDFKFAFPLVTRFSETDANHHINDTSYFIYFSEARNGYFATLGLFDYPRCRPGRPTHFSVHFECDYRSQLACGQRIEACARVLRVGRTSIDMAFGVFDAEAGRLAATGRTVCIHWDPAQGGLAPIPPEMRRAMEQFEGRDLAGAQVAPPAAPSGEGRFPFKVPATVRFLETDSNGHVNDVSFLWYLSDARNHYFERLAKYGDRQASRNAYQFLTAHLSCNYKAQLSYGDVLDCKARMARLGRTSAEMEFALVRKRDKALAATGRGVIVGWDDAKGTTAPLRPAFRKAVAALERRPALARAPRPPRAGAIPSPPFVDHEGGRGRG